MPSSLSSSLCSPFVQQPQSTARVSESPSSCLRHMLISRFATPDSIKFTHLTTGTEAANSLIGPGPRNGTQCNRNLWWVRPVLVVLVVQVAACLKWACRPGKTYQCVLCSWHYCDKHNLQLPKVPTVSTLAKIDNTSWTQDDDCNIPKKGHNEGFRVSKDGKYRS